MDKDMIVRQSREVEVVRVKHHAFPRTRAGWVITGISFVGSAIVCAVSHFDGGTMLGGLFVVGMASGFSDDTIHALLYGKRLPEKFAMSNNKPFNERLQEASAEFAYRWLGFERPEDPKDGFKARFARMCGMPEPEDDEEGEPKDAEDDAIPMGPARSNVPSEGDEGSLDIDALFQVSQKTSEDTTIPRLLPNDIIRNTEQDSYLICIGRSLTKKGNPPIWINFNGQHLKLIGASQYGKSSMAACILYLISRTHSPENVLIALLDLEHKTSKLFANLPHLAEVDIDGTPVLLHAKTKEQVLEHLFHIVAIMDQRYAFAQEEVEQQPILLVYLEEFLALKDYFKRRIDALSGEAKEQAKKDYSQLVFNVSEIARRGLKVKVQLLMCAQVDYRDDDFREALINITGGMSFTVDSSAARAAGFMRSDLLNRNATDDKKGQAVVETPDCKDLVLAPEYNLKKKLLEFEKARQAQNPEMSKGKRSSMVGPATGRKVDEGQASQAEDQSHEAPSRMPDLPSNPSQNPNVRKLTYLHRQALEHYRPGLGYRQLGELIGVGKDKAGDLLKDLRKWGFLDDDSIDE